MTAYICGVALSAFGRQPGRDTVGWQELAAEAAMADAGLEPDEVDGLLVGYSTTAGHLMPANVLAERLGVKPGVASGMSAGGATTLAMLAHAVALVASGSASKVVVVAGEDRASGQSRETSTRVLAQVGHERLEVSLGGTVPAYYALLASRYLWQRGLDERALASLPVQMRAHAARKPGAHYQTAITVDDVMASRPVSEPLKLLDCCPVSDGSAALVVSAATSSDRAVEILGIGQANEHQHLCALDPQATGAALAAKRAFAGTGLTLADMDVYGIYDSFSITVAMILEEIGLAPTGKAGAWAAAGAYELDGRFPLNTHGGLLSYGHCGVAGGMAHVVEVVTQLRRERGSGQVQNCDRGYVHADGGILSAHAGVVLGRGRTA